MDVITPLKEKLRAYIAENNPELLGLKPTNRSFNEYINEKIQGLQPRVMELIMEGKQEYTILAICFQQLTEELRPSKAGYIKEVLQEEFPVEHRAFQDAGVLTFEIINLIELCIPVFQGYDFSEQTKTDRRLRYAIIAEVHNYLHRGK